MHPLLGRAQEERRGRRRAVNANGTVGHAPEVRLRGRIRASWWLKKSMQEGRAGTEVYSKSRILLDSRQSKYAVLHEEPSASAEFNRIC